MKKLFFLLSIISIGFLACENPEKENNESKLEEGAEEIAETAEDVNIAFKKKKDKLQADLLILKNRIKEKAEKSTEALEDGMNNLKGEGNDVQSKLKELKIELEATTKALENSTKDNIDELQADVKKLSQEIDDLLSKD